MAYRWEARSTTPGDYRWTAAAVAQLGDGAASIGGVSPSRVRYGYTTYGTLTGQHFGATEGTLTVGGSAATISSWSDTSIVFYWPSLAAGAHSIVVTAADATTDTLTNGVTYVTETQSIREQIAEALIYNLKTITAANGYRTNIRRVYDPAISHERVLEKPAINVYWGREERLNDRLAGNNPLLDMRMVVQLVVFLDASADKLRDAQNNILADIQGVFGQRFFIPSSGTGDATAFDCAYLASEPWGPDETEPKGGIVIDLEVFYSFALRDATARYNS